MASGEERSAEEIMAQQRQWRGKAAMSGPVSRQARRAKAPDVDAALIQDLVLANRILYDQGIVDAFGHVSVRHDKRRDCFLLARNMAPGLVTAADIMLFHLDGNPVAGDPRPVYLERFIHSEIYRVRSDVGAVVHSHSPSVIPFGVAKRAPLRPLFHMAHFLPEATPVFEIRSVDKASDLLIRNAALGAALAKAVGSNAAVLMRGHGATVVGGDLKEVVYRAIYTEINARLQASAIQLGPVTYLNRAEAARAALSVGKQITRAWDLWRLKANGGDHA
jgi:ribulose-5-phosphate 4-epimerase/fuculose-1-phosphate aldolase